MSTITLLHNPRCSKSRQARALLQENGIEPDIIEYLKTPLNVAELASLAEKLGITDPVKMMRVKEPEYKALGLHEPGVTAEQRFAAMAETPKLMERPVVIHGERARIGRPPECVLDIIK